MGGTVDAVLARGDRTPLPKTEETELPVVDKRSELESFDPEEGVPDHRGHRKPVGEATSRYVLVRYSILVQKVADGPGRLSTIGETATVTAVSWLARRECIRFGCIGPVGPGARDGSADDGGTWRRSRPDPPATPPVCPAPFNLTSSFPPTRSDTCIVWIPSLRESRQEIV